MNIRRIEAEIIECFFASEELEKIPLSAQDIQKQTPAARKFLERLVTMAADAVNYKPLDKSNLYMIVIEDPIGTIVYLYEGNAPETFMQEREKLEKYAKDIFTAYFVDNYLEPLMEKESGQDNTNISEPLRSDEQEVDINSETQKTATAKQGKLGDMLFCFRAIHDIISLASLLPQSLSADSVLYIYKNRYYVYLTITEHTDKAKREYFKTCTISLEFAEHLSNPKEIEAVREHGKCLIPHGAILLLKG